MNLRPISLRVIARHYAAERQLGARCKSETRLWNQAEAGWRDASTHDEAATAAAPAFALCGVCPLVSSCAEWAQTDRYTGLAAGMSWNRGKARRTKFGQTLPARRVA
jgi:adenine-specific DNA glycosylase